MTAVTDPALSYAQPDVEAVVLDAVRALGGMQVWSFASGNLQPPGWLFETSVQVDTYAATKEKTWARADAMRRVVCALPWTQSARSVIAAVAVTDGPFWFPEPEGRPRYVTRFAIRSRPPRPL